MSSHRRHHSRLKAPRGAYTAPAGAPAGSWVGRTPGATIVPVPAVAPGGAVRPLPITPVPAR